jgi:iron complex outermembrane receptor protein
VGFVPPGPPNFTPIFLNLVTEAQTDINFDKVTWKGGVEYDLADDSLLYATVATGFKGGVLYGGAGEAYSDPEEITAYTLGSKNRFMENRLQVNAEAFYWDYSDQQISHLSPTALATTPAGILYGPVFATENAGNATLWGLEVDLEYLLTDVDLLSADIQYLDTKYDEFDYQAYSTAGDPPYVGCPTTVTSEGTISPTAKIYDVDCSGQPLVNAPDWSLNLGYQHTFELDGSGRIIFGLDSEIQSSRYLSIDYVSEGKQDSYTVTNVRVTYETQSEAFALTGYVNNLENEIVYNNSFQSPVKSGTIYNQMRPPRVYGVRASYRF